MGSSRSNSLTTSRLPPRRKTSRWNCRSWNRYCSRSSAMAFIATRWACKRSRSTGPASPGCDLRRSGLEHAAQFYDFGQDLVCSARFAPCDQQFRGKLVPVLFAQYHRPLALTGAHHPHLGHRLYGLADNRAADVEAFAQRLLRRDGVARLERPLEYRAHQLVGDLGRQRPGMHRVRRTERRRRWARQRRRRAEVAHRGHRGPNHHGRAVSTEESPLGSVITRSTSSRSSGASTVSTSTPLPVTTTVSSHRM